jgi:hypothetical protein
MTRRRSPPRRRRPRRNLAAEIDRLTILVSDLTAWRNQIDPGTPPPAGWKLLKEIAADQLAGEALDARRLHAMTEKLRRAAIGGKIVAMRYAGHWYANPIVQKCGLHAETVPPAAAKVR